MFPFKCAKCSHYSFSAGIAYCFHCGSDATANAAIGDKFLITQPQIESSKDNNDASGSRNPLVQTDMQTVNVYNSNRNESDKRMIAKNKESNKQPRQKLWGEIGPNISPYFKPDSNNCDLLPETFAAKRYTAADNSHLVEVQNKLLNNEKIETLSHNKENLPADIGKSRIFPISQSDASNVDTIQSDNWSRKIPDTGELILESCYMDVSLAVPGPSGLHNNTNMQTISQEKLHSWNPAENLTIEPGYEKELICPVCDDEIAKHVISDGRKIFYICCVCKHKTNKKIHLKMHSYIHCPRKICNICEKEYAEGNNHESEHRCCLCPEIFQCSTDLDEHYLNYHMDFFSKYCCVCSGSFDDHIVHEKNHTLYVCCLCGSRDRDRTRFTKHNETHLPKIFCKHCKEEYQVDEKRGHNDDFKCIVCDEKFQCKILLNEHSRDHDKYFLTNCRVCKKKIIEHKMKDKAKSFYFCCLCKSQFNTIRKLRTHLCTHADLRLYKCDVCGRRYKQQLSLLKHLQTCIPLPYKCEVCRARFPNIDSLNIHCSKKHSLIREEI